MKINKIKAIIWNIPFVGLIYLLICTFNKELWFDDNLRLNFSGLIIQLVTEVILLIFIFKNI